MPVDERRMKPLKQIRAALERKDGRAVFADNCGWTARLPFATDDKKNIAADAGRRMAHICRKPIDPDTNDEPLLRAAVFSGLADWTSAPPPVRYNRKKQYW